MRTGYSKMTKEIKKNKDINFIKVGLTAEKCRSEEHISYRESADTANGWAAQEGTSLMDRDGGDLAQQCLTICKSRWHMEQWNALKVNTTVGQKNACRKT
jgi:hypothetical protein